MEIILYHTDDNATTINKVLTDPLKINIMLKRSEDILSPKLILSQVDDPTLYNYVFIDYFKRYYFIDNVTVLTHTLIEVDLTVDVLETFKDDILDAKQFYSSDGVYTDTQIIESDVTINNEFGYVLTTLGVD